MPSEITPIPLISYPLSISSSSSSSSQESSPKITPQNSIGPLISHDIRIDETPNNLLLWGLAFSLREIICKVSTSKGLKKYILSLTLASLGFGSKTFKVLFHLMVKIICNPFKIEFKDALALNSVFKLSSKLKSIKKEVVKAESQTISYGTNDFFGEVLNAEIKDRTEGPIQQVEYNYRKQTDDVNVKLLYRKPNLLNAVRRITTKMSKEVINENVENDWLKIGMGACVSLLAGFSIRGTGYIIDWQELIRVPTKDPKLQQVVFKTFARGSKYEVWSKEFLNKWKDTHPEYKKSGSGWAERKKTLYKQLKDKMGLLHTISARQKAKPLQLHEQLIPFLYKLLESRVRPAEFIKISYSPAISFLMLGFYGLFMKDDIQRLVDSIVITEPLSPIPESHSHDSNQEGGMVIPPINEEMLFMIASQVMEDEDLRFAYIEYTYTFIENLDFLSSE